jgi:hypothetical protein
MFLVDTVAGRIIEDDEIKSELAAQAPYADWLRAGIVHLEELPGREHVVHTAKSVARRQQTFGYTDEELLAGVTASDPEDGDLSAGIVVSGDVPVPYKVPGTYTVYFDVTDSDGFVAPQASRTITVQDTLPPGAPQPGAFRVIVTPDYLETLGLTLVEGRFYEEADLTSTQPIFVVDETFARKYFPNRSAVGGRFTFGPTPQDPTQWPVIVGVVKDVPHNGVEEKSGNPFIYQVMRGGQPGVLTLFIRNGRPATDVVDAVRRAVQAIDPAVRRDCRRCGRLPHQVDKGDPIHGLQALDDHLLHGGCAGMADRAAEDPHPFLGLDEPHVHMVGGTLEFEDGRFPPLN